METALMFAETVFYLTVSVTIIVLGVWCALLARHFIRIARELGEFFRNLHDVSSEVGERIRDSIDRISDVPILSYFLKKHSTAHERKGRSKSV
ncbi:MAG: hypothetical protein NUV53_05380 [Patescibacteria group bacterium]|nr:hypothetical protein [Patescibacteria group bacterium]